ncbi:MAG: 2-amino-3,7-dideoxy-D-threo-hept-6-ulosonate synthase [Thermoproteota archaeon]
MKNILDYPDPAKRRRLRRIFREDGKTVIIPMDHGVSIGPVKGLENMKRLVEELSKGGVDAVVVHKGWAKLLDFSSMGLIIHGSAGTDLSPDRLRKTACATPLEALALGADGFSLHVNVGSETDYEQISFLARSSRACSRLGLPLLAMMYPRGAKIQDEHSPKEVSHAARIGVELGADVVKTNYTGSPESFKLVVESSHIPVVIAGGPKTSSTREFLKMVSDAISAGAAGVSIGRNVFQHEEPRKMAEALKAIVHEGASVDYAMEVVEG